MFSAPCLMHFMMVFALIHSIINHFFIRIYHGVLELDNFLNQLSQYHMEKQCSNVKQVLSSRQSLLPMERSGTPGVKRSGLM